LPVLAPFQSTSSARSRTSATVVASHVEMQERVAVDPSGR
jgi:hypothetical protein